MEIGAQLYTVRDFCKTPEDFAETLKKVADIGYRTVQVSGTCAYEPEWLAEQLGTTRGAVSQIIEKMVRKGPLTRVPDPDDRRSVRITLSPEGLKQHRKICVSFDHLMKKMLEGVEEEKVRIFTEVLDHLIASRDEIA